MYAIVDIETTGSHAGSNGITEIAIVLHNGSEIEGRYETLINPGYPIPRYVSYLTGITNEMVASAPSFSDVCTAIYRLLKDRVFVAHNVNFDYSFIKHSFGKCNINWSARRLCTMRLSRTVFSGLPRYGLDALCDSLNIAISNRHRAGGDADATAILFDMILKKGGPAALKAFMAKQSHEQLLPPNLPKKHISDLPHQPGVYRFLDEKYNVIYVGKAVNIKQRVLSHFSGLDVGKKRQELLRNIYAISYQLCATELTASIVESVEIKKNWPRYNKNQKYFEQRYGLFRYEDQNGFLRIVIDKKNKFSQPLMSFGLYAEAHLMLRKLVKKFELHPYLCYLDKQYAAVNESSISYNKKVEAALQWLKDETQSFVIVEKGSVNCDCVVVENGTFLGIASLPLQAEIGDFDRIRSNLHPLPENEVIRTMIRTYCQRNPHNVVMF